LHLLRHTAGLLIYLLYGAHLLADVAQLQFVHGGYACESAVEVLHLLAVGAHAGSLLLDANKHLGE